MEEHSPPSSKKSSVISKLDRADTPRMSPYQTRSRRSSTLTEENIALHNESPTTRSATRRVTRRMSQGSENAVVLTPMPLAAKRTRRSPSVASGDDPSATPKKKFSVAQENVVMEEDEPIEETKVKSPGPITNGSKTESKDDKANISTIGSESVLEATDAPKLKDSNENNSLTEETTEPKVAEKPLTHNSNEPTVTNSEPSVLNTNSDEVTMTTESPKPIVSIEENSEPSATPLNQEPINKSPTDVVAIEPVSTKPPHASVVDESISVSETSTTTGVNEETMTSVSELNDTVFEVGTPAKSNNLSVTEVIIIPDTPIAAPNIVDDGIRIPGIPPQAEKFPITDLSTPATSHPIPKAIDFATTPKTPLSSQSDTKTSVSDLNDTVLEVDSPAESNSLSAREVIIIPETPIASKSLVYDGISIPGSPPQAEKYSITDLSTPTTPHVIPKAIDSTPKTLLNSQGENIITSDITGPVTVQPIATGLVTPKPIETGPVTPKPIETGSVTPQPITIGSATPQSISSGSVTPQSIAKTFMEDIAILETPQSKTVSQNMLNVTESEEEFLLRTPPTPSRISSKPPKSGLDFSKIESNLTMSDDDSTSKSEATPSKTEPLQNNISVLNDEYPKWGGSIRRKSDGQPIDKFGVDKVDSEVSTLKVKPRKKDISIVNIRDSSDEESCDEEEKSKSTNMFLDDEAMESNGEASMDEDERRYLEENEIPEDGISLGSDSEPEESDENESNDSFIVSDSDATLLNGSGDDLELETASPDKNTSIRRNKIFDTSDDELEEVPIKQSATKRRHNSSLKSIAKYARMDDDESSEENELANLDAEPRKRRTSKRLSDTKPSSKVDVKRQTLDPNMKLSSLESNGNEQQELTSKKNDVTVIDVSSEDEVTQVLANLDTEPKNTVRSKRLSESLSSSKKDLKRLSLHPNTKFDSVELINKENEPSVNENGTADKGSEEDVEEILANLDDEPKQSKNPKRLSEVKLHSKKEMKRLSLHPNTKINSVGSKQEDEQQQSVANEEEKKQQPPANEEVEGKQSIANKEKEQQDDNVQELSKLDDTPKKTIKSKRLSDSISSSKMDTKRLSLHPNTKLNGSGLESKEQELIVNNESSTVLDGVEKMEGTDNFSKPEPSASKVKMVEEHSVDEIKKKCDEILQRANEAKLQDKMKNKKLQLSEEKHQRSKEKKAAKLQKREEKKARQLEEKAMAEKKILLKREKKSKIAELTEQEKAKAIQKALEFSELILAKKAKISGFVKEEVLDESTVEEVTATTVNNIKRKRKPKMLQILSQELLQKAKKRRVEEELQIPAKPEGFKINSLPVKINKVKKDKRDRTAKRVIQKTSAGSFDVAELPVKQSSPFVITTLTYNPLLKFSSLKDSKIANSKVERESVAQLLNRKKKQKKI